jgi:hypothetical protein
LLELALTAPYGLSGDVDNLDDFSDGAVMQHFPKSLARVSGVDFRHPTREELQAMTAFMLGISNPDTNRITLDRLATTEAQKRGRALFLAIKGGVSNVIPAGAESLRWFAARLHHRTQRQLQHGCGELDAELFRSYADGASGTGEWTKHAQVQHTVLAEHPAHRAILPRWIGGHAPGRSHVLRQRGISQLAVGGCRFTPGREQI